ncbi:HNH endonuclease [Variovorax sp. RB2P76]|uniref:HNH endonuclease n=1 Tax=Variovorax sp. RB2P76 TaxID=3443736 RepID=UPI003F48141E
MSSTERSAITNAIWLCGNCHKLVDDDPGRFPVGLLFEWQQSHEQAIAENVGKTGVKLRKKYEARHLEEFGRLSYLAERIVSEKDEYWEYRLTAEVLRFELAPILRRWRALNCDLYVRPISRISGTDFLPWFQLKLSEVTALASAFGQLMNVEIDRAWGEPGKPGSDIDIVTAAKLVGEMCQSCLDWEESICFTRVDPAFEEVRMLFVGVAGRVINEAAKLPAFLVETFSADPTAGSYRLELVLDLAEGWEEEIDAAMDRASKAFLASAR